MKQFLLPILITLFVGNASAQLSEKEVLEHRLNHEVELSDTAHGVLNLQEIEEFGGLDYFEFDAAYQIEAKFIKKKGKPFEMPTSTDRLPIYRRWGCIEFKIGDSTYTLEVYQNMGLRGNKDYRDYYFVPFRDKTCPDESYGGGRYLDLRLAKKQTTVNIDFNLAYNPYCAYSHRYSCPIPPEVNTLTVRIPAGEKNPLAH